MGILWFVCPITGNSVSTNLEIDAENVVQQRLNLSKLAAWLTEDDPKVAWWTEDDAPVRRRDSDGNAKLPSGFS
jgi:hypothetical protein